MRKVMKETSDLSEIIMNQLRAHRSNSKEPEVAAGLIVHHQSLLRNKRCALAYLSHRLRKVQELWWETGRAIPDQVCRGR